MAKTSLERSHSKSSNFKLTMICFMLTIAVSCVWVGLSLVLNLDNKVIGSILLGGGGALTLLFLFLVGRFTR